MENSLPKLHAPYSFAFEIEGETFYVWDDLAAMPLSRKFAAGAILDLRQLRISDEALDKSLHYISTLLDPASGSIQPGNALVLIHEIRKRLQMLPLPKLVVRLAVQIFFKLGDDFEQDLSPDEAERRYELFLRFKKKVIFYPRILSIIGLHSFSESGLSSQAFLQQMDLSQIIADQQEAYFSGSTA